MQGYVPRQAETKVAEKLAGNPIVALLGPRQCGKTTLARRILETRPGSVRLDLELPSDRRRLADPEAFLAYHRDVLVCLDEVQRTPEIFPVLRSFVDDQARPGQILILGSASPDLLQQASESLAGRIAIVELTPFLVTEIGGAAEDVDRLWIRGGFPRSLLASSEPESVDWRRDFVRTFLERDVPQLRPRMPVPRLSNFWTMCAHEHGQTLNASKLAASLGVGSHTVRSYAELLQQTFMIRLLPPCESNLKKRLVKASKLFLRDSGILHALLEIDSHIDLAGHPSRGSSWEGFVTESVISALPGWRLILPDSGGRRTGSGHGARTAPFCGRVQGFQRAFGHPGILVGDGGPGAERSLCGGAGARGLSPRFRRGSIAAAGVVGVVPEDPGGGRPSGDRVSPAGPSRPALNPVHGRTHAGSARIVHRS